jgi:hypothetical protein
MLSALVGTWLLVQAKLPAYGAKVLFVAAVGLVIGIAGHLPEWNWWHFSGSYTLLEMADLVISWTLAGLVLGKSNGTRISVNFYAKGEAKSQVALQHEKLPGAAEVARKKKYWGDLLAHLG